MSKITRIIKELNYSNDRASGVASALSIGLNTVLFHIGNKLKIQDYGSTFTTRVAVGGRNDTPLTMRRFSGDLFIFYEVFLDEAYHIPDVLLAPRDVRVIVDCGANIGFTSLYFSERYPNAKIYAIEASERNFKLLKKNVQGQDRIIPIHAAVTASDVGTVTFSSNKKAWGNHIVSEGTQGAERVAAITLADLSLRFGFDRIDLLKVDIEGGEVDLFSDPSFLDYTSFGVIELHPPYSIEKFRGDLAKKHFEPVLPCAETGQKILAFRSADFVGRQAT